MAFTNKSRESISAQLTQGAANMRPRSTLEAVAQGLMAGAGGFVGGYSQAKTNTARQAMANYFLGDDEAPAAQPAMPEGNTPEPTPSMSGPAPGSFRDAQETGTDARSSLLNTMTTPWTPPPGYQPQADRQLSSGQASLVEATRSPESELRRAMLEDPELLTEFATLHKAFAGDNKVKKTFEAMDPQTGRPTTYAIYGNGKTVNLGVSPIVDPEKAGRPEIRDFTVGDKTVTKQWNPASGEWQTISEGPRWNPNSGASSTSVNVTNYLPGDAKIPPEQRNKFSDQRAILEQTRGAFDALKSYNPGRMEAAGNKIGLLSPEAATADASAATLEFNMAKLYDQGALQAPDKATVQRMIGDIRDPMLSPESRAAKYKALGNMIDRIEKSNFGRIESAPPEKAPVVAQPSISAADRQAPVKSRMPAVGAVEGGYKFKGGDPSRRENWEPAR